jgi:hypothetical protein
MDDREYRQALQQFQQQKEQKEDEKQTEFISDNAYRNALKSMRHPEE